MPAPDVDLVFVLEASMSIKPCFDQLRAHLCEVIRLQQEHVSALRFGVIAQSVATELVYDHTVRCGCGQEPTRRLYQRTPEDSDPQGEYLTDDPDRLISAIAVLEPKGDEDMLVALDIAMDLPFRPVASTKRVVALFSDEAFEAGPCGSARNAMIPALIDNQRLGATIGRVQTRPLWTGHMAAKGLGRMDRMLNTGVHPERGTQRTTFAVAPAISGRSVGVARCQCPM